MNPRITDHIPSELFSVLEPGQPALLITVDIEGYSATAYIWLVARDPKTVHFGVDHGSASLANLERNQRASLQIIAPENLIFLVKGTTRWVKSQIEAAPFKIGMMALHVVEVKDQSWPGVRVNSLGYDWDPDQREAMLAMEQSVYTEMRKTAIV